MSSERLELTRRAPEKDKGYASVQKEELSNNDEGAHTWFVGEQPVAAKWVGRIFKQVTVEEELDVGK